MAQKLLSAGAKPAWGQGGPKPPTPRTPLVAKGKEEEKKGKRGNKKREEEERTPLGLGLALPLHDVV